MSTIRLGLRFVGQMELTVKLSCGKAIKFVVNASDKVESLKAKIENETGKIFYVFNISNLFDLILF